MDGQRGRARSFLIGGVVGASAVLAAARRRRSHRRPRGGPGGLAAFEEAPCYTEAIEREREAVQQERAETQSTS